MSEKTPEVYDDILPVPEEWKQEHVGQWVTITMATDFAELLECSGHDEWWEIMDARMGVVLTQWEADVVPWDKEDQPTADSILLAITGVVEDN